jgi:hypothetical protein
MALNTADELLTSLLPEWHLLLQGWSADGRLTAAAQEALLLEGTPETLQDLVNQWGAGVFTGIPPIVLLSSAEMNGAMGAYAISTGMIYLNADWLAGASKDQVNAALTEELGHHLDGLLNASDTAGDEGEYFARLLNGVSMSEADKATLLIQNDESLVTSGSVEVTVENAAPFLPGTKLFGNSLYRPLVLSNEDWYAAENKAFAMGGAHCLGQHIGRAVFCCHRVWRILF